MADAAEFGVVLPHRATLRLQPELLMAYAVNAEAAGFRDLWVTENVVDSNFCLNPALALALAAGITSRIGLGVAVAVLPVHHPIDIADAYGTLHTLSRGRSILAAGLGRPHHYEFFGVPMERRVRRFVETVDAVRMLWREPVATYDGQLIALDGVTLSSRPETMPPIWFGGGAPNALTRAARLADGWVGSGGGESNEQFRQNVVSLREKLAEHGRDPSRFPISKRIFMSVDKDRARARAELRAWFGDIYGKPQLADTHGAYGTRQDIAEHIEELRALGATHLILNPVGDHLDQLDELREIVRMLPSRGDADAGVTLEAVPRPTAVMT